MMIRTFIHSAFLLLLVGGSICTAAEQWFEAYDAALNDIKAKNWLLAETRLKNALKQHPEQGRKVRAYGARFMRYFPEYYLGVVYFHTGKHQNALEHFLRVQNKGLIGEGDEEYKEMTRLMEQAMVKMNPQVKPSPADTTKPVQVAPPSVTEAPPKPIETKKPEELRPASEATHVAPEIEEKAQTPPPVPQGNGKDFLLLLGKAEEELERSRVGRARQIVNEAKASANADSAKVSEMMRRIEVAEALIEARRAYDAKDWKNLERRAAALEQLDPANPELQKFAARLNEKKAMVAFYSGDFDRAILLLQKIAETGKLNANIHFYMGCNLAALGFFQGKKGQPLLEQARQEFAAARRLEPELAYDRQFISPRILKLYERTN